MAVEKFNFKETGMFSPLFIDFINKKPSLQPFYENFPDKEGFLNQINSRKLNVESRKILANRLIAQYKDPIPEVSKNIESLRDENTFTITTGHQLNIFTGPLYFAYKIITVINACKELQVEHPSFKFVPVYWMASEDHDFEEISYFQMLGNKYTWETDQTGAVGRMDPKSLKGILEKMPGEHPIFKSAYLEHETLSDAVRYYVNELFGKEGLVVLDADDRQLKALFEQELEEELTQNTAAKLVGQQSKELEKLGYKPQISARDINLFYLDNSLRERIVMENGSYKILNSKIEYSEKEIIDLLKKEPEKFSPNVILRPLYQEVILPNLAYVGGPAELVYWLQLKSIFDHFEIQFPILLPRNFVLYLDHVVNRKLEQSGATLSDVFLPKNEVFKKLVSKIDSREIDFDRDLARIKDIFDGFNNEVTTIDPTLTQLVDAEKKKTEKSVNKIVKKGNRAILRKHKEIDNKVSSWFDTLNPSGGIQERTLNYLHFAIDNPEFLSEVATQLDPFDLRYHVITGN